MATNLPNDPAARRARGASRRLSFFMRRSRLVVPVMFGLIGCGTTVPLTGSGGTAQGAGLPGQGELGQDPFVDGARGPAGDSLGPAGGAPEELQGGAAGKTPRTAGQASPRTGAGGGDSGGAAGSAGPAAGTFGVTATSIYVGIPYVGNADAVIAALGGNATTGDVKAVSQNVIDEINKRGGIHGRKLVPIFYAADGTVDPNSERQAMCAAFTEDAQTFAVLAGIGADGNEIVAQCVTKVGGVLVYQNISLADEPVYRRYPGYVQPGDLRMDRAAHARVDALLKAGYFSPWNPELGGGPGASPAKVGILTAEAPQYFRTVRNVLLPRLKSGGQAVDPDNIVYINMGTQDGGLAALQNAVLRFRQNGVSHVIILDAGGGGTLFFARAARDQGYYPRYGLDSYNAAQLWMNLGMLQADMFNGAVGVGWVPMLDLEVSENPVDGAYSNSTRKRCVALQRAKGQPLKDVNAERIAVMKCDELWLLEAALKAGGPTISRTSFLRGLTSLGTSYVDGQTFSTRFTDRDHDGVASARPFAMVSECGCFRYTGPLAPVP